MREAAKLCEFDSLNADAGQTMRQKFLDYLQFVQQLEQIEKYDKDTNGEVMVTKLNCNVKFSNRFKSRCF